MKSITSINLVKREINNNNRCYCLTHGRTRTNNHTSKICNNKKEGHQDNASLNDRKNGNNKYYSVANA